MVDKLAPSQRHKFTHNDRIIYEARTPSCLEQRTRLCDTVGSDGPRRERVHRTPPRRRRKAARRQHHPHTPHCWHQRQPTLPQRTPDPKHCRVTPPHSTLSPPPSSPPNPFGPWTTASCTSSSPNPSKCVRCHVYAPHTPSRPNRGQQPCRATTSTQQHWNQSASGSCWSAFKQRYVMVAVLTR